MNKKVPFKNDFDSAKKWETWSNVLPYISIFLLLAVPVIKKISNISFLAHWLDIINCMIGIGFAICQFIGDCIHFNAETFRRDEFIDNALGSKLAEQRSKNYYTNDNLACGLYKMGVNSFESCFFSYHISKQDLPCLWFKGITTAAIFVLFAITGYAEGAIFIIQSIVPLSLLQNAIKQQIIVSRLKTILEKYRSIFSGPHNEADILRNIFDYEGTMSWANTLLNEKTYRKLNVELSKEWKKIKKEYSIA